MANAEQRLRNRCIKYAKANGWTHIRLHFGAGAARGWPDDLFLKYDDHQLWVEFKAPGKEPSRLQILRHTQLRCLGASSMVCDDFELFKINLAVS